MKQTRILLADDHPMMLDGLVSLLGQEFEVVDLPDIWDVVREELQGTRPVAAAER